MTKEDLSSAGLLKSTVRKARIKVVEELDHSPSNPECECITLEPLNCDLQDFLSWFVASRKGLAFCQAGDDGLIQMAGTDLDISPGAVLIVSYDEYFEGWLDLSCRWMRNKVSWASRKAAEPFFRGRRYV